jgi:hypothetical protein
MKIIYSQTCPTCGRAAYSPFRVYVDDKVVSGCVDHFHGGHLVTPSQSASWHARPEAKRIRAATKAARSGFVTELLRTSP